MQLRILLWLGYALLGLSFSLRPRSLCGVKVSIFSQDSVSLSHICEPVDNAHDL